MSAITISLPDSFTDKLKELADREGITVEQFLASAASEKLSACLGNQFLEDKAAQGNDKAFDDLLRRLPDHEPFDWDRLPSDSTES